MGALSPQGQKPLCSMPVGLTDLPLPALITAAAIWEDGVAYWCERPCRHHHVIWAHYHENGRKFGDEQVQGFITEAGQFVDREQGLALAKANGQFRQNAWESSDLFSEDLW